MSVFKKYKKLANLMLDKKINELETESNVTKIKPLFSNDDFMNSYNESKKRINSLRKSTQNIKR